MKTTGSGTTGALIAAVATLSVASTALAATHTVSPGHSIQAAVDAAAPNDTVLVLPGDYTETHGGSAAIRITKPIKLRAKSKLPDVKVRILPGPGNSTGILAEPANEGDPDVDGLRIQGFTVEGFSNMGIWLRHVQHYVIQGNESIDNLENGIWPTLSANGLVKKNVSYGSNDSALWVEGSENVRVIDNELHHSPTGLEVTVSNNVLVKHNDLHDNTIGMGLYHPSTAGLPPLQPLDRNGYWRVVANHVHDNNQDNTGDPGSETSQLPKGGGILLLGVDHVSLKHNLVEHNDFFGIAMIDYCIAVLGTDFDCSINPPEVSDTAADENEFLSNKLVQNGLNAPAGPFAPFASDILALGGVGNCYEHNFAATTIPSPLMPHC